MEGAAQDEPSTERVVRKDWKAVMEGMAQARWAPEEVVARPIETLTGEKQKSSPGKRKMPSRRFAEREEPGCPRTLCSETSTLQLPTEATHAAWKLSRRV